MSFTYSNESAAAPTESTHGTIWAWYVDLQKEGAPHKSWLSGWGCNLDQFTGTQDSPTVDQWNYVVSTARKTAELQHRLSKAEGKECGFLTYSKDFHEGVKEAAAVLFPHLPVICSEGVKEKDSRSFMRLAQEAALKEIEGNFTGVLHCYINGSLHQSPLGRLAGEAYSSVSTTTSS